MTDHVTSIPWISKVQGTRYGTDHTYIHAAEWLRPCQVVADWGGGRGHFQQFLPPETTYRLVDGTSQVPGAILANLADYHEPSEGILLRHVLEMTTDWAAVLENAVAAFTHRMVIVTFTPNVLDTHIATHHLTWPCHHFNHDQDLIPRMWPYLKGIDAVQIRKSLPERVYYLEKL